MITKRSQLLDFGSNKILKLDRNWMTFEKNEKIHGTLREHTNLLQVYNILNQIIIRQKEQLKYEWTRK